MRMIALIKLTNYNFSLKSLVCTCARRYIYINLLYRCTISIGSLEPSDYEMRINH